MRLDEFVLAVNKRVAQEKIRPADPRARAKVTARTIQFYVAEGLIPSPTRIGSRLDYDETHIEAVLVVKRQQAAGMTLDQISTNRATASTVDFLADLPLFSRSFEAKRFEPMRLNAETTFKVAHFSSAKAADHAEALFRWHISVADDIEISGSGRPPDRRTIRMIREILQVQGTDTTQEEEE
jgi:hypothetical protein